MDPDVWGPATWDILFTCAAKIRNWDQGCAFLNVVEHLRYLLPCRACRSSFGMFVESYPPPRPDVCDAKAATKWLWRCKDSVNQKLSKPYRSYRDSIRKYRVFHTCTSVMQIADVLCIMARNTNDDSAWRVVAMGKEVAKALASTLGVEFVKPLLDVVTLSKDATAEQAIHVTDGVRSCVAEGASVKSEVSYEEAEAS